jgi:hypothetical protein
LARLVLQLQPDTLPAKCLSRDVKFKVSETDDALPRWCPSRRHFPQLILALFVRGGALTILPAIS